MNTPTPIDSIPAIGTPSRKISKTKISIPPSAPKKTPPIRPRKFKPEPATNIEPVVGMGREMGSVFQFPAPRFILRGGPPIGHSLKKKYSAYNAIVRSSPIVDHSLPRTEPEITPQVEGEVEIKDEDEVVDIGHFEPDGITKDIYVQGSK